ncbi:YCF48-related protein [Gracilimonas sp. BCB1]|uniref:YCF48-related protein n=1 Tax=Gracilimonas sp. BCB1 TaxID=3152362 RepID=UPI0032D93836
MKKYLLFFICVFTTCTAFAQWEEVYRSDAYVFDGLYFLDDDLGFALYNGFDYLYRTNDGFETSELVQIPNVYSIEGLSFYDSEYGIVLGDNDNIHRTTDGGKTWSNNLLKTDEPLYLKSLFTEGRDTIYVAGRKLLRSINKGDSWEVIADYDNYFADHSETMYERETVINIGAKGKNLFITNYFVYKTSDGGQNLNPVSLPLSVKNVLSHHFVDSYVVDNSIYIISNSRGVPKQLFKSHDSGNNWQEVILPNYDYISVNGINEDTVFITGNDGILLESSDGFNSWTENVIDPDTRINDVLFTENKTGYLVTDKRIYRNNQFRVITSTNTEEPDQARGFRLKQNYPNPFNPATNIEFTLQQPSSVVLSVYNIMGRKVDELYNGVKSKGSHTLTFDASRLSGGIYFYELKTPSFIERRKMTLVK